MSIFLPSPSHYCENTGLHFRVASSRRHKDNALSYFSYRSLKDPKPVVSAISTAQKKYPSLKPSAQISDAAIVFCFC